jgi:glutamate dehydrogenase
MAGMVRAHHRLARTRLPGQTLIRVFDPVDEDWSPHATVIQVVTDDMPYLVDSVHGELERLGVRSQRVVHPIVVVRRDDDGVLRDVLVNSDPEQPPAGALVESWMTILIDKVTDDTRAASQLAERLHAVLDDVRAVGEDSHLMRAAAVRLADTLRAGAPTAKTASAAALLQWLADGRFVFLGSRRYAPAGGEEGPVLGPVPDSGSGMMRKDGIGDDVLGVGKEIDIADKSLLLLTPASGLSTICPFGRPFFVAVRNRDESGRLRDTHCFLGIFTATALHEDVLAIPVVREKVREAIQRAGVPVNAYSGQRILEVLQDIPLPELFAAEIGFLHGVATEALPVGEQRRPRLFLRRDPHRRFYSCLVYLPRDKYTTASRLAMREVLRTELGGLSVECGTHVGEATLARVHFLVHTEPSRAVEVDATRLQALLTDAAYDWGDRMIEAVIAQRERDGYLGYDGDQLSAVEVGRFLTGLFPESYKADFSAEVGLADFNRLRGLAPGKGDLEATSYVPGDADSGEFRLKLYVTGPRVTLSAVLPMLQCLGVRVIDERAYEIRWGHATGQIIDLGLRVDVPGAAPTPDRAARARFESAFGAVWTGAAEADRFNALVLRGGLDWRQAVLLRAYARYLRQAGTPYSQSYIESTLLEHSRAAAALVRLFETRFDPEGGDRADCERLAASIRQYADDVTSLDADRILRGFLTLLLATVRTNYFVRSEDGQSRPMLALKFTPRKIPDLPQPRPRFEVFVYSPRVEGVHLRFGPVARGGLRWSDRPEDFRTEILGLVKAQAVKNAVIVPVGAKGGFVVKRPGDGEGAREEGRACYRIFVSGLLEITDNLVRGQIVAPAGVVRYDEDDPYLVVAADKGTATFSDIANEVARSHGFWLGDAFASGGSAGYDHKTMGITAKGAWASVQRHFRELGVDTQQEEFSVVGVGDMSGDVFGNGMLLSRHIRLIAAFDHRHVFVDPDPDPAASFVERQRLFVKERSSWADYDPTVISTGGGVWPRSAKSVPVGPEMRAALGLAHDVTELSTVELIRAILVAPADLLWNGGIGTYVKAAAETHADVGDKTNDSVRVDGGELRVKVVGEGGNLGLTQRGRIEFARAGGKVNTDALDNSAGVDCSDHEVNIKILTDHLITEGELSGRDRDPLLVEMTDEVGELVLADNHRQNTALGVSRAHAPVMALVHGRVVADLEQRHGLDRRLEILPTASEFAALEREGRGLSSPELATLMAQVKLALKEEVLATDLVDEPAFADHLLDYFPTPLQRYGAAIGMHPLRREITATLLVNEVVDRGGLSYVFRLAEEMAVSAADAVRAFAVVSNVFDLHAVWRWIDALDNIVPTGITDGMVLESRRLLDRASRWMLSHRPQPLDVEAEINRFGPVVRQLDSQVHDLLRGEDNDAAEREVARLTAAKVPEPLANRTARLLVSYALLDVAEVTEIAGEENTELRHREVADLYFALSAHLRMDELLDAVSALERDNRWHALARLALRDELYSALRAITLDVSRASDPDSGPEQKIQDWEENNTSRLTRARYALDEIRDSGRLDLPALSVAARQVRGMAREDHRR